MTDFTQFIPPFRLSEHVLELWQEPQLYDTSMTVLMGFLVSAVCGWIGCYLILQGMALLGDAISHTVLLGIVIVVLLGGSFGGPAMFCGAALTGLATTLLIEALHSTSRVKEDAATGIVFTSLFALGVVLIGIFAGRAHIDTSHVLFGNLLEVANGQPYRIGRWALPVPVAQMSLLAVLIAGLIGAFYKELLVVSFDPQLAASLGLRPRLIRYAMMAMLSVAVVGAFESVGAILVVAMLISPAATAYLLTRRLSMMFLYSTIASGLSSLFGFHLAYWLDVSPAGAMVTVSCSLFTIAFLFGPQQGIVAKSVRHWRLRLRTQQENLLRCLLEQGAVAESPAAQLHQLAVSLGLSRWSTALAVWRLRRRGWLLASQNQFQQVALSFAGRQEAERLERAHRLWETYLVEHVGLAVDHVHPTAEEIEHLLSDQLVEKVDDALGHPDTDPLGEPIPRSSIADWSPGVFSLSKLRIGDRARIVGLGDSPVELTGALRDSDPNPACEVVGLVLTLGQELKVTARNPQPAIWVVVLGDGHSRSIPHHLADRILVQRLTPPATDSVTTTSPSGASY
ncbi:MAG: metal ABC transporter permease [Planctomycetes bacterium]|nr:metal ABC transporter permease [Planctomycetota bacterium]